MQTNSRIKAMFPAAAIGGVVGIYLLMISAPGGRELFLNPAIDAWHQFQQQWDWLISYF